MTIQTKDIKVLKLNRNYFPLGVETWENVCAGVFAGSFIPVRIIMDGDEIKEFDSFKDRDHAKNRKYNKTNKTIERWKKLKPVADENFIMTPSGPFLVPKVVVCDRYERIPTRKAKFPSKRNIWERDNYTCGYTGKKLNSKQLSIDHIIPKSRGGKDTWENLITCDRKLNSEKSNRTPEEHGLTFKFKPYRPHNGYSYDIWDESWKQFLGL